MKNYPFVAFHIGQYQAELLAYRQVEEGFSGIISPTAFGIGRMFTDRFPVL